MRHVVYGMGLVMAFLLGAALKPSERPILTVVPDYPQIPLYLEHNFKHDPTPILVLVENSSYSFSH